MSLYLEQLGVFICVYSLVASSTCLTMGIGGLFSAAQAAFFGVGAYVAALLELDWHWGFVPAWVAATAATALIGAVAQAPALRLRGDYLVVASLAIQSVASTVFVNAGHLTGGPGGLAGIPLATLFGFSFASSARYLVLSFVVLVVVMAVLHLYAYGPWGRVVRAVRDDEMASAAVGKRVVQTKLVLLAIGSGVTGLAGAMYANYMSFISSDNFALENSVVFICAALLGGLRNVYGGILGGLVFVGLPELLRLFPLPVNLAAQLELMIYGAGLIILMLVRPQGLLSERINVKPYWRRLRESKRVDVSLKTAK